MKKAQSPCMATAMFILVMTLLIVLFICALPPDIRLGLLG
jgi:hypothetical protein